MRDPDMPSTKNDIKEFVLNPINNALGNYANFSRNASQIQFWCWVLWLLLLFVPALVIRSVLAGGISPLMQTVLFTIGAVLALPTIALFVRRFGTVTNRNIPDASTAEPARKLKAPLVVIIALLPILFGVWLLVDTATGARQERWYRANIALVNGVPAIHGQPGSLDNPAQFGDVILLDGWQLQFHSVDIHLGDSGLVGRYRLISLDVDIAATLELVQTRSLFQSAGDGERFAILSQPLAGATNASARLVSHGEILGPLAVGAAGADADREQSRIRPPAPIFQLGQSEDVVLYERWGLIWPEPESSYGISEGHIDLLAPDLELGIQIQYWIPRGNRRSGATPGLAHLPPDIRTHYRAFLTVALPDVAYNTELLTNLAAQAWQDRFFSLPNCSGDSAQTGCRIDNPIPFEQSVAGQPRSAESQVNSMLSQVFVRDFRIENQVAEFTVGVSGFNWAPDAPQYELELQYLLDGVPQGAPMIVTEDGDTEMSIEEPAGITAATNRLLRARFVLREPVPGGLQRWNRLQQKSGIWPYQMMPNNMAPNEIMLSEMMPYERQNDYATGAK